MERVLAPSVSVRLAHPSVETMFFPACRPVTGDTNPDNGSVLTADKFGQYLFHGLLLGNRRALTSRDADILAHSIDPRCRGAEEKTANVNPMAPLGSRLSAFGLSFIEGHGFAN